MTDMPEKSYPLAPDLNICRILNGMWQVAGGHGKIDVESAISEMFLYHDAGFTTWDMADIYGPAEEYLGKFRQRLEKQRGKQELAKIQAFTKFVPNPGPMTRSIVQYNIEQSIKRMKVPSIDLLQFHWWDYLDTSYLDALYHLSKLCNEGKIRYLGLTNFDTERMQIMVEHGYKIISNQVQYSILDQRPQVKMTPFCQRNDIKILAYGTLLGGFLTEQYLGKPEPMHSELYTSSLQKYKNMIDVWGGWRLFQQLLATLDTVAKKYQVSIANVATRFILERPSVAGVIIGARLGISEHRQDNMRVFSFQLDSEDMKSIQSVMSRSEDLISKVGDCGDEYR